MFKHILVPTDGSELSQKAIRSAAIMALDSELNCCGRFSVSVATPWLSLRRT